MYRKLFPVLALAVMFSGSAAASAQASPDTRHGFNPTPNFELYGGYSYVFNTYNPTSTHVSNGRISTGPVIRFWRRQGTRDQGNRNRESWVPHPSRAFVFCG